jgi:biopolymer transport protein TolQ
MSDEHENRSNACLKIPTRVILGLIILGNGLMFLLSSGNPFIHAYLQSDWFGKGIFWGLFFLSGISWTILIQKGVMLFHVRRLSKEFISLFSAKDPLGLQFNKLQAPHPFFEIYKAFKIRALSIVSRNHFFQSGNMAFSESDLDLLAEEIHAAASCQMKKLERHLFILPTVVTLGPFIGLLGTVWGILMSFSQMQGKTGGTEAMLAGLSLALAATVIGLVVAIPAVIGNNYLKNALREWKRDTEDFSHLLLSSVELHYQKGGQTSCVT